MDKLGEKIGDGATADVHAWAPGLVVKLLKPGLPDRLLLHEARVTRAVAASSAPAPKVLETVKVDGRLGLVLSRLEGPTLMQMTKSGAVTFAEAGALLADALRAVHRTPPPPDLPMLRDSLSGSLQHASARLGKPVTDGVLAALERLSPGDGLCHGDPNPGNVMLTPDGPRLIDWIAATRAPAAFDLAAAQVMLTELAPQVADDPERPRAVGVALQQEYARLAGVTPAALAAEAAPYLPVVRVLTLLGGGLPALRSHLVRSLEADFPG